MSFWDEENVSEFDLLEEAAESEAIAEQIASEPVIVEPDEEEYELIAEESAYELDEKQTNVVYNAKLRLEQARLYDMLISHDFFEGVEADEKAKEIVKNEIAHYLVHRLEILMGIRTPKPKTEDVLSNVFNPIEVDFLKALAYKGTLGKSGEAESAAPQPAPQPKPKPILKPLAQSKPKPMVKKKVATKPAPQPAPQPTARKKPVKNNVESKKIKIDPSGHGRQLTKAEAEAIAKKDLEEMNKRKPWAKMSQKEKIAHAKSVNEKYARKKPEGMAPMPTASQLEQKYMTEQMLRGSSGANQVSQFNNILANVLINKKNQEGQ